MAGITGIILKNNTRVADKHRSALGKMLDKLAIAESQIRGSYIDSNILVGNVVTINSTENDRFHSVGSINIVCVIEGLVYIAASEKEQVQNHYDIKNIHSDYELIPYLYEVYGEDIVHHITGWYNVLIYDTMKKEGHLFNDRLGYLPLYFYEDDSVLLFASKIDSILASGLLPYLKFDATTIAEHLFFNYPLSDHTNIYGINSLSNALEMSFDGMQITRKKYWEISEFFDLPSLNKKKSFELIDQSIRRSLTKFLNTTSGNFNLSLTGGWDSRLVLSYLLPEYRDRVNLYSFGAESSLDIIIPELIAQKEDLHYEPFILDQRYLDEDFIPTATKTIMLSGGTRNYKRTHYLFAVERLSRLSPTFLSGIFGDEVLKVGKPLGGEVLSPNAVDFIDRDFAIDHTIDRFRDSGIIKLLQTDSGNLLEEIRERLIKVKNCFIDHNTIAEKFFAFRFELNLRKYFGYEINSYNDFAQSFSSFIDYDFLKDYAQTCYFVARYAFRAESIALKSRSTNLYADLVKANYPNLAKYSSTRGFSLNETKTLWGKVNIIYQKKIKRKRAIDEYNTKPLDKIFLGLLNNTDIEDGLINKQNTPDFSYPKVENINSLLYWRHKILNLYGEAY